jgi:hypothetical protein
VTENVQRHLRLSLEFFAGGRLASKKKRLGVLALAAQFERAEVLEPRPCWNIWSGFQPNPKLVEVVEANVAVAHSLDEMVANGRRDSRPGLKLGHLFTENQTAQLVA